MIVECSAFGHSDLISITRYYPIKGAITYKAHYRKKVKVITMQISLLPSIILSVGLLYTKYFAFMDTYFLYDYFGADSLI